MSRVFVVFQYDAKSYTKFSNPLTPTIKETAFVYQIKAVFSCILEQKRAKYGEIGHRSGRSADSVPDSLRSGLENG